MFIKLTLMGTRTLIVLAVDNIAAFQSAENGALVTTKVGSSYQVNQPVHMIANVLDKAGLLCLE